MVLVVIQIQVISHFVLSIYIFPEIINEVLVHVQELGS